MVTIQDQDFQAHFFGIEWIGVDDLIVDHNYQRPVQHALVKNINEGWDWRAVRTLAVSLRSAENGTGNYYSVIDGQQRLTAARERDIDKLPCQVYVDLTPQQEAELFLKLNNSRKPTTNDMFRALVAGGDKEANQIVYIVEGTGWYIDLNQTTHGAHENDYAAYVVPSAATLLRVYRRGGALHLRSVMQVLSGWRGLHLAAGADILDGMSRFLHRWHGQVDMSRLTEKLSMETPDGLLGAAIQLMAAEKAANLNGQHTRPIALARVIQGKYNKGLRRGKLLDVESVGEGD